MITERQIKSRFQKRHIITLVNEMLSRPLSSDSSKRRYELRPGITPQIIADSIRFDGQTDDVYNVSKYTGNVHHFKSFSASFLNPRTNVWTQNVKHETLDLNYPDAYCNPNSLNHKDYHSPISDQQYVDLWIKDKLIRNDCFLKDNSVIPIFI